MLKISRYDAVLIFLIASSAIYVQSGLPGVAVIALQLLLIFKAVFVSRSKDKSAREIVASFLMSPEPALFLFFWFYIANMLMLRGRPENRTSTKLAFSLLYISFGLFLYNFFSEKLVLNYFLWLSTFFSGVAAFLYARKNFLQIDKVSLLRFLGWCATMQIILLVGQAVVYAEFSPGDWATGSLGDAHKLGFWLLLGTLFFWFKLVSSRRGSNALLCLLFIVALYLCDAKAILLSAVVALPVYLLAVCFLKKRTGRMFVFPHPGYGFVATVFLYAVFISLFDFEGLGDFVELYVVSDFSNAKYVFLNRVWVQILDESIVSWVFGTGPGTLGSRAANILSSDVLYKLDNSPLAAFSSSSFWTRKYMYGLWTEELATNIQYYSAVLAYPFSGISTLKAELGILGLVIYISMIFSISMGLAASVYYKAPSSEDCFKLALSFSLVVYAVAMLFDNYQEQPGIAYLLCLLSAIYSQRDKRSESVASASRERS